jgi:Xaa-Pro aminopeptidase
MRSAVAGRATPELSTLAEVSNAVIEAVCGSVRGGVPAAEVAAAGDAAIESLLPRILWHHTYGYSVGLGFAPAWIDCPHFLINRTNDALLLPGMVFHLPTQLRVERRYGAGFSETIIVTESGCEPLSKLPRQLLVR